MLTPLLWTVLAATPALPVNLRLEPVPGAPTAVTFRLANAGESPLRVAMHRGLLGLEVQVPGRRAKVKCLPPAGARPSGVDPERVFELAPGASRAEVVDVRWYCWGARAHEALTTPGATLVARYGFRRRASARTWVASSPDGATRVASLEAEPVAAPTLPAAPVHAPGAALSLRVVPEPLDVRSGRSLAASLRLENASPDDVRVLVRPESFQFEVQGPREAVQCGLVRRVRAPLRESFTRLGPRRRTSIALDLAALCPEDTFASPGVYEVVPSFESFEDGARVGLRAVTGTFSGAPLLVRVGAGDRLSYEAQEPPR